MTKAWGVRSESFVMERVFPKFASKFNCTVHLSPSNLKSHIPGTFIILHFTCSNWNSTLICCRSCKTATVSLLEYSVPRSPGQVQHWLSIGFLPCCHQLPQQPLPRSCKAQKPSALPSFHQLLAPVSQGKNSTGTALAWSTYWLTLPAPKRHTRAGSGSCLCRGEGLTFLHLAQVLANLCSWQETQ